jgi:hypothetical protein
MRENEKGRGKQGNGELYQGSGSVLLRLFLSDRRASKELERRERERERERKKKRGTCAIFLPHSPTTLFCISLL